MMQMKHLGLAAGALMLMTIASLATLLMTKADPWSGIEVASASSLQGMSGNEIIAVPVGSEQGNGKEYLTVIAKTTGKSLIKDAGDQAEWMMVVYEITQKGMQIHAMRPIEYELRSRWIYNQEGESEPSGRTNLNDLEPKKFAEVLKK